jgi:uncharacterized protein (TIGR03086 family)
LTVDRLAELLLATEAFDRRVVAIPADGWGAPTPCDEWTVRDLVEHVTGGNRFAVPLLDGASLADAFDAALAPGFSDDTLADLRSSADAQLAAFAADGALDRICHHPRGDITGSEFAGLRIGDLAVHAWDLARATGGDEHLDDRLVAAAWAAYEPRAATLVASAWFGGGASGTLPEGAPLQDRLLDLLGRRP